MFNSEFDGYELTSCCTCGSLFGVLRHFIEARRADKKTFYCPNGHELSYRESIVDKLQRERDLLKQREARLNDELREANENAEKASKRAYRAEQAKKRLEKRTAAGTCPCCQRTFSNMAEHMKHQHPEFVGEAGAKVIPIKRKRAV